MANKFDQYREINTNLTKHSKDIYFVSIDGKVLGLLDRSQIRSIIQNLDNGITH